MIERIFKRLHILSLYLDGDGISPHPLKKVKQMPHQHKTCYGYYVDSSRYEQ
jgi:hypothetical protein